MPAVAATSGPTQVEGEQDGLRLERREAGCPAELVSVELLLDHDDVSGVVELGVDGVAATAEVHEIEQVDLIAKVVPGQRVAGRDVGRRDLCPALASAALEQLGQQCLEQREPLWRHRAGIAERLPRLVADHAKGLTDGGWLALVRLEGAVEGGLEGRGDGAGADRPDLAAQTDDPADEDVEVAVGRKVTGRTVIIGAEAAVSPPASLDQPCRVGRHGEHDLADLLTELPGCAVAETVDDERARNPEIPLTACGEPHVAPHPRDPEHAFRSALVVVPDDVPLSFLEVEPVRVDRALRFLAAVHRVVPEHDRALARDRALELGEALGNLGRVAPTEVERDCALAFRHGIRTAEREALEREPERLGVRELPLEQVEARLQGGEFGVRELERGQEVLLGGQDVQLLARQLVTARRDRDAERRQLRAVGVEAPRKGLVGHARVPLDGGLGVARGDVPLFRHEEGDERQQPDQLVAISGQVSSPSRVHHRAPRAGGLAPRARPFPPR